MSLNAIELASFALSRFIHDTEDLAKARIKPPPRELRNHALQELRDIKPVTTVNAYDGQKAVRYDWRDSKYIAIPFDLAHQKLQLLDDSEDGLEYLSAEELPEAISLYLIRALELAPIYGNELTIIDEIISPAIDGEDGVELTAILRYLQKYSVIRISEASIYSSSPTANHLVNYLITFQDWAVSSPLAESSLQTIRAIFHSDKDHLIGRNLFWALESKSPRYGFLECYRTLEFLFGFPRSKKLLDSLKKIGKASLPISEMELARLCSNELGWRLVERDALTNLLREYADYRVDPFNELADNCEFFSKLRLAGPVKATQITHYAEMLYKIRNQTVHQFWPDEELIVSHDDYVNLADFILGCIFYFYDKYFQRIT